MTQEQQGGQYDPADHTVEEVNDYLANADDAERERVLQAERDDKDRVGITGDDADNDGPDASPEATANAIVVQRPGTVDQAAADKDADRRNAELVEQGTLSDRGYIGSDASDLAKG